MSVLFESFASALRMIGSLAPDLPDVVRTSLAVSAGATVLAALFGIVPGLLVGVCDVPPKRAALLETTLASLPARGTTAVMTTHAPDHPERLDGGVIVLEEGRVVGPALGPGLGETMKERGHALL